MSNVEIRLKEHGPVLVSGDVAVFDHLGNPFNTAGKSTIALCRCGASKNRPFCDGSHKAAGFQACDVAPPAQS